MTPRDAASQFPRPSCPRGLCVTYGLCERSVRSPAARFLISPIGTSATAGRWRGCWLGKAATRDAVVGLDRAAPFGQRQPRERRAYARLRGRSRSSGTAPGAPDRRDRRVATGSVRLAPAERRMRSRGPVRARGTVAVDEGRPAARRERDSASVGVSARRDGAAVSALASVVVGLPAPKQHGASAEQVPAAGGRAWASDHVVRRHVRAPTLRIRV